MNPFPSQFALWSRHFIRAVVTVAETVSMEPLKCVVAQTKFWGIFSEGRGISVFSYKANHPQGAYFCLQHKERSS